MSDEWQKIETAPKDGTWVDLWATPWDAFAVGNAHRFANCRYERDKWWCLASSKWIAMEPDWTPTNWMPLPSPPAA